MVILMHIPSSVHCVLHSGPIQSARWIVSEADCKVCYAALRAAALEKSATTTLSVAFNLICSLISGNSARTRNPDLSITASKPLHPHILFLLQGADGSARKTCSCRSIATHSDLSRICKFAKCSLTNSSLPAFRFASRGGETRHYIPI